MKTFEIASTIWKEGKHYVAQCLNVDVSSFGNTKKQAQKNLQEAVALYLEDQPIVIPRVQFPSIVISQMQYA